MYPIRFRLCLGCLLVDYSKAQFNIMDKNVNDSLFWGDEYSMSMTHHQTSDSIFMVTCEKLCKAAN